MRGQLQAGIAFVVVMGDFGRSPRMQYHSLSLANQHTQVHAQAGLEVHVVAYGGSRPIREVQENNKITVHQLQEQPSWVQRVPGALRLLLKGLLQLWNLLYLLFCLPSPSFILLQVPPALPTLPVCWLAACWHHAQFIIDWHNFGYTIMGLSMGHGHWLVRTAERLERFWGRRAAAHLCVSRAMQQELATGWRIRATVFHDRPPPMFRPTPLSEAHLLWLRLTPALAAPVHPHDFCSAAMRPLIELMDDTQQKAVAEGLDPSSIDGSQEPGDARRLLPVLRKNSRSGQEHRPGDEPSYVAGMRGQHLTLCTRLASRGGQVEARADRPAVLVSSTSWTPDEDFGILLEAAQLYDQRALAEGSVLPKLLVIVTGKGPLRAAYQRKMQQLDLRCVAFRTLWLESEDYPRLLGACDMGVSLHISSSGFDLPMKVVDMFGSGLPVCAADYQCIDELVIHGQNGLTFSTAEALASCWADMLIGFPTKQSRCLRLKESIPGTLGSWDDNWQQKVMPLLVDRVHAAA